MKITTISFVIAYEREGHYRGKSCDVRIFNASCLYKKVILFKKITHAEILCVNTI